MKNYFLLFALSIVLPAIGMEDSISPHCSVMLEECGDQPEGDHGYDSDGDYDIPVHQGMCHSHYGSKMYLGNRKLPYETLTKALTKVDRKTNEIVLSSNNLTQVPSEELKRFAHLKSLILSNNNICEIDKALFRHLRKLENFDVSNNNLAKLPKKILLLTNLVSLDLSNNPEFSDSSILEQLILQNKKLEYLYLRQTNIQSAQLIEQFKDRTALNIYN